MTNRGQSPLGAFVQSPLLAFGKRSGLPCHDVWHNADDPGLGTSFNVTGIGSDFANYAVGVAPQNDCDNVTAFIGGGPNSRSWRTNVQRKDYEPVSFADMKQFVLRGRTSGEILDVAALLAAATDKVCLGPFAEDYYGGGFVDSGSGNTAARSYEYHIRLTEQTSYGAIQFFVNEGLGFSNSLYPNLSPNEFYDVLQCPEPVTLPNVAADMSTLLFEQNGTIGRYQFSGVDSGVVTCALNFDFISPGRGFLFSQINIRGYLGPFLPVAERPVLLDLLNYTWIGQTSGGRWRLDDEFNPIGCLYQNPGFTQQSHGVNWIGATPPVPLSYPDPQVPGSFLRMPWRLDEQFPNASHQWRFGSERGDPSGHPAVFVQGEDLIGYPPGAETGP